MNGYGSHMPILTEYVERFRPENVLEFGCGDNSTPLFIEHCKSVVSIEMQKPDWFLLMFQKYGASENLQLCWMPGAGRAPEYLSKSQSRFDLVFVDGHMQSRVAQIEAAFGKTDVIITHDTDQPCYRWGNVHLPDGWAWIDVVSTNPWTTIITHRHDVIEWVGQFKTQSVTDMNEKKYPVKPC